MGLTPRGIWFPGDTDPIVPLAPNFALLADSVDLALNDLETDLTVAWPQVSVQATGGTLQVITPSTVVDLTGNSGGWATSVNTGGANMGATIGVGTTPIHLDVTGLYAFVPSVALSAPANNRGFVNVNFTGAMSKIKRTIITGDDRADDTFLMMVTAVPTSVGIQVFTDTTAFTTTVISATLDVFKIR